MSVYIHRFIEKPILRAWERGKSFLLLGPRQTGKTTLVKEQIHPDISYSFAKVETRQRYEKDPGLLEKELIERLNTFSSKDTRPLIFIDDVQKIPRVMDIVQNLIDEQRAHWILTGSSARKLKSGTELNLLPGRVVALTMTPLF